MAILAKGATVAAALAEEEKKNRPGFHRVGDLVLKDGDKHLIRFITEITDLTTMSVHRFMPTKAKPAECDWDKWPDKMWAICANDNAFRVRDGQGNMTDEFEDGYGGCYLCSTYGGVMETVGDGKKAFKKDKGRPDTLTYGLAVVYKVTADKATGNVSGFTEDTEEFKAEGGDLVQVPKIVLVSQRWSTFWHPVQAATFLTPNVIRDKVFAVSRKEKDLTITPVATDAPGSDTWKKYDEALGIIGFSLDEHLLDHASPDHYAKFFDPGRLPADGYSRKAPDEDGAEKDGGKEAVVPAAQAGPDVDLDKLNSFAGRLSSRGKAAAAS